MKNLSEDFFFFLKLRNHRSEEEKNRETSVSKFWPKKVTLIKSLWLSGISHGFLGSYFS